MKLVLLAAAVFLAFPSLTLAQQSQPNDKPVPTVSMSQPFPLGDKAFKVLPKEKYPLGQYNTDFLTMSNYGAQGILIMGLGDEFNGIMINFSVCNIWAFNSESGFVNWGDQTAPTPIFFGGWPILPRGTGLPFKHD